MFCWPASAFGGVLDVGPLALTDSGVQSVRVFSTTGGYSVTPVFQLFHVKIVALDKSDWRESCPEFDAESTGFCFQELNPNIFGTKSGAKFGVQITKTELCTTFCPQNRLQM